MATSIDMLQKVAKALGPLCDEVVFVGGTVPSLLVTDPAAPPIRPTVDVDIIVDSRSVRQHAAFEERLRKQGFQIKSPPICRYGIDDVIVDVMMTTHTQGFSDQWYAEAFSTAEPVELPDKTIIRRIRAPLFLATKLNAWRERGQGDYYHHDLEDILAVIDGRPSLLDEIRSSSAAVKRFLAESFAELLKVQGFRDAIPGHIRDNSSAAQRTDMAIEVIKKIITMGQGRRGSKPTLE